MGDLSAIGEAMRVRDSGMPDEFLLERLCDVELILDRLDVVGLADVTGLGCGYGTSWPPLRDG